MGGAAVVADRHYHSTSPARSTRRWAAAFAPPPARPPLHRRSPPHPPIPHLCQLPDHAVTLVPNEPLDRGIVEDCLLRGAHLHPAPRSSQHREPAVPRQLLGDHHAQSAARIVHLRACGQGRVWEGRCSAIACRVQLPARPGPAPHLHGHAGGGAHCPGGLRCAGGHHSQPGQHGWPARSPRSQGSCRACWQVQNVQGGTANEERGAAAERSAAGEARHAPPPLGL